MSKQPNYYRRVKDAFTYIIDHPTILLAILLGLGGTLILWHLNQLSAVQIRTTSLANVQLYTEALTEFRTLYSSEVVLTAKKHGLEVTHDYASKDNAIPLPATLSMLLGNTLGGIGGGVSSKLYSKFPFPWRTANGGISDKFAKDAWLQLSANSSKPFYRFEDVNGRPSLRYATADMMRESCVNCHNNHPDSPKKDWQVGQLRGILEVTIPIEANIEMAKDMVRQTSYILSVLLLVSLTGIGLVVRRLRRSTTAAKAYAKATNKFNDMLTKEMLIRQQAEENLRLLTFTDPLTDIANRRKFDQEFDREWLRGRRYQSTLALILVDIDYFKAYNDNYGHQAGDEALRQVASVMHKVALRSSDLVARFGGEEFVLLMPETNIDGAMIVAENLRRAVEAANIIHAFSTAAEIITISAGVAAVKLQEGAVQAELLSEADNALYFAKHSGRNCAKNKADQS